MCDIPSSRRDSIMSRLTLGQPVSSVALAAEFGVSEDAIRRDLRALATAGLCRRVYGGALPLAEGSTPMASRANEALPQKRALATAVALLIEPGSFVFIDNGSTNLMVAEALPPGIDVTIATNSIEIAAALATRGDVQLVLVGGEVDPVIGGCVDGTALEAISRMNIDICLLGACTVSREGGVSAFEIADATFKRALVASSRETIVLVTNEKLGRQAPHRIADVDALDRLVVEHDAPGEAVAALQTAGAVILHAAPPTPRHTS